jgi:hypothetical protein
MWSDKYWYFQIRSDSEYSKTYATTIIIDILTRIDGLEKVGPQKFETKNNFPWATLYCANLENGGYSFPDNYTSKVCNLIDIVASKFDLENQKEYIQLFKSIANKLDWELILEEDDNENCQIVF